MGLSIERSNDPDEPAYWLEDTEEQMVYRTAQEAFDTVERVCPGEVVEVNINPHNIISNAQD